MPINRHRWTKAPGGGAATSVSAAAFPLLAPDGSVAAPSYSLQNETATGMLRNATVGGIEFAMGGVSIASIQAIGVGLVSTKQLFWHSSNVTQPADTGLARAAAGVLKFSDGAAGSGWSMGDAGKTRLAANHTVVTNSATLAAINNLTTTVAASRHYKFRAMLHFTTVNTSGVKVAVSGTATHTDIIYDVTIFGISTPAFLTSGRATAKDTAVGVTASGTACYALIEGFTTINAAGTLLLQAAQNAETGAAESVIALRGSSFEVTDFA